MGSIIEVTRGWGRAALDVLLPPQCLTCDAAVDGPGRLCATCFGNVHFITAPCCHRCGVSQDHASPSGICDQCAEAPPPWNEARAALEYDAHSRRIVLPLKHNDRPELAAALAAMMARAGAGLLAKTDLLVPVPLHPARLRARRYNQAALLACAIGRLSAVAVARDALVRIRPTPPLGELSAIRRVAAVAGVFAIRRGSGAKLQGRRILLIDDVLTSGATCAACTRALISAGATNVDVLVAARVPDPRRRHPSALAKDTVSHEMSAYRVRRA